MPRALARASDRLLDLLIAAFAGWTIVYHVCLLAGIGTTPAFVAGLVALAAAIWWARGERAVDEVAAGPVGRWSPLPAGRLRILLAVNVALGVAAGLAFGLTSVPYRAVWIAWLAAAACSLALGVLRRNGDPVAAEEPGVGWTEVAVVAAWALGLAALSLFLLDPDGDDAFYVHFAAWIAAHGQFPTRDVIFSDQVYPALYYPPVFSYEALTGVLSRIAGISVANLQYYVVAPIGCVLSVLAFWRLLRSWRVPLVALALTVALAFLLFDAGGHMTFGAFFASRMWQGKVLLLAIGVPVLFALLHEQGDRPSRRTLVALFATGVAGVGLSTTAIFLVPVIAAGCVLGQLARERTLAGARAGLVAFAAACAYPVATGIVTKLLGGRTPDVYTAADVVPSHLVHYVLGTGAAAVLGLAAVLVGPSLLRRASAARMVSGTVLLVGLMVTPRVPVEIFHLTGLGRVLWRLTWALPAAALLGAIAVSLVPSRMSPALRMVPAAVLIAIVAVHGTPAWHDGNIRDHPVLKRHFRQLDDAQALLPRTRPGALVLAPKGLSQTLLVLSGQVTTVSPRGFFTVALRRFPALHVPTRRHLEYFAQVGFGGKPATRARVQRLGRELELVGVDAVCINRGFHAARGALRRLGWRPLVLTRRTACSRAPVA